jgi:large subunit ribosomal protein L4
MSDMSELNAKVYSLDGAEQGVASLPEALFGQQVHEHLLYLAVKRHLGNQRQGNAKVKNRSEVSGGGRKPFRQKGTGRARQGANNTPLMPGGGRAFGPSPRDYRTDLPKRQRRQALTAALSQLAAAQAVAVLDGMTFAEPKTSQMAAVLKRLGLADKRTLLVLEQADVNVLKSCRNLRNLRTTLAHQLNPYEVVNSEALLVTAGSLERMKEVFSR